MYKLSIEYLVIVKALANNDKLQISKKKTYKYH